MSVDAFLSMLRGGNTARCWSSSAFRVLGSDADAQDVVQEAWVRHARSDVDKIDNVSAWLTTVVTPRSGS